MNPFTPTPLILPVFLIAVITLHQTQALTFGDWQPLHFTPAEVLDVQISGESADPDGDGLENLLEYALNGDPKQPNPELFPTISGSNGGAITFQRRTDSLDLDYVVEVSTDLENWSSGFDQVRTTNSVSNSHGALVSVTSQLDPATFPHQFLRVRVDRSARSAILSSISDDGNAPATMLADSIIPSGDFAGALSRFPIREPQDPNYLVQWYFGAQGLYSFVETHPALVKTFIDAYLAHLDVENGQPTHRIHDFDLWADIQGQVPPPWSLRLTCRSDSDDAYAASILRLAGKLKQCYPGETWFDDRVQALKDIAYHNIVIQAKNETVYESSDLNTAIQNYTVKVFQNGQSNDSDPGCPPAISDYHVALFMDNVQVWAGLDSFVEGLEIVEGTSAPDVLYYRAWRDQILGSIHAVFWDTTNQAWRANDVTALVDGKRVLQTDAASAEFYPDLQCQYFPQLYGMPFPGDTIETQRRYNQAWKWLVDRMPDWHENAAWAVPANPANDFSQVSIAIVALQHGEQSQVESFLQMARSRWLPGGTAPNGTVSEEIGYWQTLVGW